MKVEQQIQNYNILMGALCESNYKFGQYYRKISAHVSDRMLENVFKTNKSKSKFEDGVVKLSLENRLLTIKILRGEYSYSLRVSYDDIMNAKKLSFADQSVIASIFIKNEALSRKIIMTKAAKVDEEGKTRLVKTTIVTNNADDGDEVSVTSETSIEFEELKQLIENHLSFLEY